jgi:hypothetical protein
MFNIWIHVNHYSVEAEEGLFFDISLVMIVLVSQNCLNQYLNQ